MKVIYFTKYSRNGASSRLRSFQYFSFLEKEKIEVTVRPLFDEAYLENLYKGKKTSKVKLLKFYLSRFFTLFTLYKYDKVVIEKELFPYFFSWFEKILFLLNVKYIVDYDDAIFHNYDLNPNKLILFFLKNKINNVMKYSSCVIVGNSYLAQRAKDSGAKKTVLMPTVIDINRYKAKDNFTDSPIVIGWIGSPSTYKYIKKFEPIFLKLRKMFNIELHIVGVKEYGQCSKEIKFIEWSEESEVELINKFDIGVMPLENTPWELGKCSYKLIQYMGCGIPVIASSIGMNNEVVKNGKNGYLVNDDNEWIERLCDLIIDKELRVSLGNFGRQTVIEKFSLEKNISILLATLYNEKIAEESFSTSNRNLILEEFNLQN